jgi:hypothetical protein
MRTRKLTTSHFFVIFPAPSIMTERLQSQSVNWSQIRGPFHVAELVHRHQPRDETTDWNKDRDLVREVATSPLRIADNFPHLD